MGCSDCSGSAQRPSMAERRRGLVTALGSAGVEIEVRSGRLLILDEIRKK